MKTKLRTVVLTLCLVVLMASMAVSVLCAGAVFSNRFVYGGSFGYVASGTKELETSTAAVYISQIYKADGSSSDYWRLYAKATSGGTSTKITKGKSCDIEIPGMYQKAGSYVALYLKGHDSNLNCIVDGSWTVH